jgi:hypothetical protein
MDNAPVAIAQIRMHVAQCLRNRQPAEKKEEIGGVINPGINLSLAAMLCGKWGHL